MIVTRVGFVIMTTIVEMVPMKLNSVIQNTRHVHHKNSLVKTSSVYATSTVAMVKMTVVTIRMKWTVEKKILPVPRVNLIVLTVNVLNIHWCVIRCLTVQMNRMNQPIVM